MTNTNLQRTVSVQNGSNKITGSSEENFGGIRNDSLIKISDDSILYTILDKENSTYIRDFTVLDSKTILIEDDISNNLQLGDNIKIIYSEYELMMILNIKDKGKNFNIGDELFLNGGTVNIDISTGNGNPTFLKVTEIDENGGIRKLEIKNKGKYLISPENPVTVTNKFDNSAQLELKYNECYQKNILEREILNINLKENKSYINFNYSLPPNLIKGNFSIEKTSLILQSPYLGTSKKNIPYQIYKDFTVNLKIPTMLPNSTSPNIIFNKAIIILDSKYKEMEDRINKLEKLLNK